MSFFFLLIKLFSFQFLISLMLSHHILMNILNMNFYNYFVTKRSLNNTPYRKFSLKCKQNSKTRKNMFKLNVFLIRFLQYLYIARIWLNLITSKAFRGNLLQMFYKIGVLEKFAKFAGKHLCWSHFLIKLHTCCPIIFEKFSRTPIFPITLQNQTALLNEQISKVT